MNCKKKFVDLGQARYEEQRKVMEEIEKKGICPFCPDNINNGEVNPVIKQGIFWNVRKNRWPYKGTKLHLLFIHNIHADAVADITKESWEELRELLKWAEQEFKIESGAIGLRFGNLGLNGSSVAHLHAHLIVADPKSDKRPRFAMGPKIKKNTP